MPEGGARCRVFYLARPVDGAVPKSTPDEHSLEARWVHPGALAAYPPRGQEVATIIAAVTAGVPVAPLSVLVPEGTRWRCRGSLEMRSCRVSAAETSRSSRAPLSME
jgi:hypothetical protein